MTKKPKRPKIIRLDPDEKTRRSEGRTKPEAPDGRSTPENPRPARANKHVPRAGAAREGLERVGRFVQSPIRWIADKLPRMPDSFTAWKDLTPSRVLVIVAVVAAVTGTAAFFVVRNLGAGPLADPTFSMDGIAPAPAPLTSSAASGVPEPLARMRPSDPASSTSTYLWPVQEPGKVTSCFGHRTMFGGLSNHKGLDIGVDVGTPVVASRTGVVETFDIATGFFGYGTFVLLRHDDGSATLYGHLSPSLRLDVGQVIEQGSVFALSGNTGYSTGPHLHFEILGRDNIKLDPARFLASRHGHPTLFKTGDSVCWGRAVLGRGN